MCNEIWLKIALNAFKLTKFEPFAEKYGVKRFTATFKADLILCMRR